MSKYFELLQRAGRTEEVLEIPISSEVSRGAKEMDRGHRNLRHEEIVNLVQRVFSAPGADAPQVVVFAGVGDDRGSSRVCALAAQALAGRAAGTVCALDANLRAPDLHTHFELENLTGLSDGLVTSGPIRQLAIPRGAGNLWVMPAGPASHDGTVLRILDRLTRRIQELRQEFDHVLINAPEADRYSDPLMLARAADGLILVIEANSTTRTAIERTKATLMAAEVRLLGAVLNNRTFPIPQSLYARLR